MARRSHLSLLASARRLYLAVWVLVALGLVAGGVLAWAEGRRSWRREVTARADSFALAVEGFRRRPPPDTAWFTVRDGRVQDASAGWAWLPTYPIGSEAAFAPAPDLAPGDWTLVGSPDPDTGRPLLFLVTGEEEGWRADVLPERAVAAALGEGTALRGPDERILFGSVEDGALEQVTIRGVPGAHAVQLVARRSLVGMREGVLVLLVMAWLVLGFLPARRLARSLRSMREERDQLSRTVATLLEDSGEQVATPRLQALRDAGERFLGACRNLRPEWEEHHQQSQRLASLLQNIIALLDRLDRQRSDRLRTEGQLTVTMNCIAEAVVTTDTDLSIRTMNPAAELLTGTSAETARGRALSEVLRVEGEDPVLLCQLAAEAIAERRPLQVEDPLRITDREGAARSVVGSCAPLRDGNRVGGAVLTLHDISELISLQEQLHHSQRLEAIGQLAGGVAHDFNNLLTAIAGHAESLRREVAALPDLRAKATSIVTATRRAAELAGRLLSFSRKEDQLHEPTDVHRVIREAVDLLKQSMPPDVEVEKRLLAHHPGVIGHRGNLLNAFINLGINARDAMPRGGRLVIATRNVTATHEHAPTIDAGTPCLEISVHDTGTGMPPGILERIFEPFFTTKERGKGTGLGLSTTANLVAACGGTITADSTPGEGTTFCLTIPTCEQTSFRNTRSTSSQLLGRTGRVLVVDDEPSIAELVEDILLDHGFTCETAHDGRGAVERYRDHGPFDLVLMDVTMPRMNGVDAFRALREYDPRAKVILCTGYGEITDAGTLYREGLAGFVVKPFHPNRLIKTIVAALDKSDSDTGRIERHESSVT